MDARLPMVTRWTVYALGAVLGPHVRRAHDPVAAWLLRHHPEIHPTSSVSSMLAMIRARAGIVDRVIADEALRVERKGRSLDYWCFGAGLDARWHRMREQLPSLARGRYAEVEDGAVLTFKDAALAGSSYARAWRNVEMSELPDHRWTVPDVTAPDTLVVMEGVASRIGVEATRRLLGRVRKDAPTARVVVDLPGILQTEEGTTYVTSTVGPRWGAAEATSAAALGRAEIRGLGYRIAEETWLSARPELRAPSGMALCAGMDALRVLLLVPA